MPMLYALADNVTRNLPRVLSPKSHAFADYCTIGVFMAGGAFFWRKNRPAATASLLCAMAAAAINLLTDYPGGVGNTLTFEQHKKADLGLAAVVATLPELMSFRSGRNFFLIQSAGIAALGNLTQFRTRSAARS